MPATAYPAMRQAGTSQFNRLGSDEQLAAYSWPRTNSPVPPQPTNVEAGRTLSHHPADDEPRPSWWGRQSHGGRCCVVFGALILFLAIVVGVVIGVVFGIVLPNRRAALASCQQIGNATVCGNGTVIPIVPPPVKINSTIIGNHTIAPNNNTTKSIVSPATRGGKNGYDSLVVLGASYCDNGHSRSSQYSSSLMSSPYVGGRHSNGPVWNEYLSNVIGPNGGSAALVNYAYSGATVDNSVNPASVPDLVSQAKTLVSDLQNGSIDQHAKSGKSLVAIWIGINTLTQVFQNVLSGKTDMGSAKAAVVAAATEIGNVAQNVVSSGAFTTTPDVMLLPLPPMDELPYMAYLAQQSGGSVSSVAELTAAFNDAIKAQIDRLRGSAKPGQLVATADIVSFWQAVHASPSSHGFADATKACLNGGSECSSPQTSFYWDSLHPTTVAHKQVSDVIAQALKQM